MKNSKFLILIILLTTTCMMHVQDREKPPVVPDLDLKKTTDTFEGKGAVSARTSSKLLIDYPEPFRNRILDLLFKPGYGAGFQHLKVETGGDINSTDGSEPSYQAIRDEWIILPCR